jgi:protein-tyrosine phosphatase
MFKCVFGEQLLVGDAISARNLKLIYEYEIAAVVDLAANELPATLGRDIVYCRFPLHDDESNSDELLLAAIETVRSLLLGGFRTLVACSAGMSRSPIIAAAAISKFTGKPFQECLLEMIENIPHDVSPSLLASVVHVCERFDIE